MLNADIGQTIDPWDWESMPLLIVMPLACSIWAGFHSV